MLPIDRYRVRPPPTIPSLAIFALALVFPSLVQAQSGAESSEGTGAEHVARIMSRSPETPNGMGLLAVSLSEARVAIRHARLAAETVGEPESLRSHAAHVLDAVDPVADSDGPGLGFGVRRAAEEIAEHMELAAEASRSPPNIQSRVTAVTSSARNVAAIAREMGELARGLMSHGSSDEAASETRALSRLASQLVEGRDLDGDGEVRWWNREGGLSAVQRHMVLLLRTRNFTYGSASMPDPATPDEPRDAPSGTPDTSPPPG